MSFLFGLGLKGVILLVGVHHITSVSILCKVEWISLSPVKLRVSALEKL